MSSQDVRNNAPHVATDSEEDDEDFLPAIPNTLFSHSTNPKRPRSPETTEHVGVTEFHPPADADENHTASPPNPLDQTMEEVNHKENEAHAEAASTSMSILQRESYPTAALYERSYRHHPSHPIRDIGVLQDELGAILVTVDAGGAVRVWRKLPRGVFFMGEPPHPFPNSGNGNAAAEYYVMMDDLSMCALIVRLTPNPLGAEKRRLGIHVEVRRLHPTLMIMEGKVEFQFSVARPHEGVEDVRGWTEVVTRRPFLLYHAFQPLLALFTLERGESLVSTCGVVLFTLSFDKRGHSTRASPTAGTEVAAETWMPVPLSTANAVVCCQQHRPSGIVVVVDEKGIIDYTRLVLRRTETRDEVLSLQVIPGLAGGRGADLSFLRQWISFDRRQRTGFFAMLREETEAVRSGSTVFSMTKNGAINNNNANHNEENGANEENSRLRVMVPLAVAFTSSGKYFTVASALAVNRRVCVRSHVFDFPSGAFLCRSETDAISLTVTVDPSVLYRTWRGALFDVHMADAMPRGAWVFLPEITTTTTTTTSMGTSDANDTTYEAKSPIHGRRITVFHVTPSPPKPSTPCSSTGIGNGFQMERLPQTIGEVEPIVRGDAFSSNAVSAWSRLDVPLKLLRLAVPASQALKDLVAQSPVGAALSQEDVKRLFTVPSRTALAAAGADDTNRAEIDTTFCTISLEALALILYTKYDTSMGALLSLTDANKENSGSLTSSGEHGVDMEHNKALCARRERILAELHQNRDFDCEELLQLQTCTQHVVPRNVMEMDEEMEEGQDDKEDDAEGFAFSHHHTSEAALESAEDLAAEERRVMNIIQAAMSLPTRSNTLEADAFRVSIDVSGFGNIVLRLMPRFAPKTVENFTRLSQEHFYNGLTFHRVIPGFMIQGGCPNGDGTGGKSIFGGAFADEGLHVMEFFSYPTVYWLCMANSGPNTNESQFFITVGEATPWLNGKHTVFGFVVAGKSVVRSIVQTERDAEDKPISPVVMERVAVI